MRKFYIQGETPIEEETIDNLAKLAVSLNPELELYKDFNYVVALEECLKQDGNKTLQEVYRKLWKSEHGNELLCVFIKVHVIEELHRRWLEKEKKESGTMSFNDRDAKEKLSIEKNRLFNLNNFDFRFKSPSGEQPKPKNNDIIDLR